MCVCGCFLKPFPPFYFYLSPNSSQPQEAEETKVVLKQHIADNTVEMDDPSLCIAVRRRHLWKDSKLVLSRPNNKYSMGMRVTFVSEAAVDEGGPRREYFRLVIAEIANNNALFDGAIHRRVLRHNLIELQHESYLIVGRIIALSLIYGGPAPHFFARAVAEYLLGVAPLTASIEDVPDESVRQSLRRVSICTVITHYYALQCFPIVAAGCKLRGNERATGW